METGDYCDQNTDRAVANSAPRELANMPKRVIDPETGRGAIKVPVDVNSQYGAQDCDLIRQGLDSLIQALPTSGEPADGEEHNLKINAAIAAVVEFEPRDALEFKLAGQMVATHNMAMEVMRRANQEGLPENGVDRYLNQANKLMRTYMAQVEALNRYRTKGQQRVAVQHQNVQVNDGGQAIVGDVHQAGPVDD